MKISEPEMWADKYAYYREGQKETDFGIIQSNYQLLGLISFYCTLKPDEWQPTRNDIAIFRRKKKPAPAPPTAVQIAEAFYASEPITEVPDEVPALIRRAYDSVGRMVKTWEDVQWHKEDMNASDERKIARIVRGHE